MAEIARYVRHEPRGVAIEVITGPCSAVSELRSVVLRTLGLAALRFEQWDWRNDRATVEIEQSSGRIRRRAALRT